MIVKDVMTWNVVTVASTTPIMEARKIMEVHKFRRLPVVDKGKLVGVVAQERIAGAGPSPATSLSVWEINYLIAKMTVKDVMKKDVVTVTPETSVESAVALAQKKGVGALPVIEGDILVGIVTTNDFFYRILNPLLGIDKPGSRLAVSKCEGAKSIQEVMGYIAETGAKIISSYIIPPLEGREPELHVHIDLTDARQLAKDLTSKGYPTEIAER